MITSRGFAAAPARPIEPLIPAGPPGSVSSSARSRTGGEGVIPPLGVDGVVAVGVVVDVVAGVVVDVVAGVVVDVVAGVVADVDVTLGVVRGDVPVVAAVGLEAPGLEAPAEVNDTISTAAIAASKTAARSHPRRR